MLLSATMWLNNLLKIATFNYYTYLCDLLCLKYIIKYLKLLSFY